MPTNGRRARARAQLVRTAAAATATAGLLAACTGGGADDRSRPAGTAPSSGPARIAEIGLPTDCLQTRSSTDPVALALAVSEALFLDAPGLVLAPADGTHPLDRYVDLARQRGIPLLLTAAGTAAAASTPPTEDADSDPEGTDPEGTDPEGTDPEDTDPEDTDPGDQVESNEQEDLEAGTDVAPDADTESDPDPIPAPPAIVDGTDCTDLAVSPSPTPATLDSTSGSPSVSPTDTTARPTQTPTSTRASGSAFGRTPTEIACLSEQPRPTPTPTATTTTTTTTDPAPSPTADASTASGDLDPTREPSESPPPSTTPSASPTVVQPLEGLVAEEIERLAVETVLAATDEVASALRAALPDVEVVTDEADLPPTGSPRPRGDFAVLVPGEAHDRPAALAAGATALAAGARAVAVSGGDPRADACAIEELSADRPAQVLAVGDFGPAPRLADRMAVVATGVQLPGGGQVFFPGRRLIALYGYPGAPELGVLGAQGISASIDRVRQVAAPYRALSDVAVVPTFEIITTVAQQAAGADGDYSAESRVDSIRPWVEAAGEAGLYVLLDLQPGRSDFLSQARIYTDLLRLPHVGLALDPEWRLGPGQVHLRQIGGVDAAEVNRVSAWLADLTERYRLPQKLLVLHQFKLSMLRDRAAIDTDHDELAILIHMDGQGEPAAKHATWRVVINDLPENIWLGWKNFYRKDTRTLSPGETMAVDPQPVMISYQ